MTGGFAQIWIAAGFRVGFADMLYSSSQQRDELRQHAAPAAQASRWTTAAA